MGECILQMGGGINTRDIAPQCRNLTPVGGDAKIDVSFSGVAAEWLPLVKFYRVIAKAGAAPASPTDGVYMDLPPAATGNATMQAALTGLTNDQTYTVRVYVRSPRGWQTAPDAKATATPQSFSRVLSENSWSQIDAASRAGKAPSLWKVGDEKNITLTTGEVLTLQIYGFNHDDLTSGGKAGITFGLKNLMANSRQMNNTNTSAGGFTGSQMFAWLVNTLFNQLPPEIRSVIKQIDKRTSAGSQSATIYANSMKLFLFSEIECFGTNPHSVAGEGSKYPIFANVQIV